MERQFKRIIYSKTSHIALLMASCLAATTPALAQSQEDAEGPVPSEESQTGSAPSNNQVDIVVVGSRVNRAGFDAPTPTTVLGAEMLDLKSSRTMVETLALLPAFRGTTTPGSGGAVAAGPGGGGFLNLRGLGTTRTLLLMDRQRLLPINANGEIDVSLLPTALLSGVDIVTGGASASWGSDAVAGVVNFRLDSRYRGLTLEAETGISTYGDAASYRLGGKFGIRIGDAIHIVGAVEHERNDGVSAGSRDFGRSEYGLANNPDAPPSLALVPFVYQRETFGGLIVDGPLNNTQFLPGGGLAPYVPCGPQSGNTYQCPSLHPDLPWVAYYTQLYSPIRRTNGFLRATWDVTSSVSLYADVLAGKSRTDSFTAPATSAVIGNLILNRDNAFLPAELAARMDANGLTSVNFRRYSRDQGPLAMEREASILRGSIGLKADLGNSWKIDAYVAYGESKLDAIYNNVTILQRLRNAVDSVRVNGTPTCRINADAISANDDPACRPLNFFGDGAVLSTPESVAYLTGQAFSKTRSDQISAGATISGEPFSTWAGPVSIAAGAEYRDYSTRITSDPLSQARAFFAINPQPLSGSIEVKEIFGEVVVPLAKDLPFAHNLEITAAGRITDYSTSGRVETWKLGANYAPFNGLRFRGTLSRDIRAPNINELFSGVTQQAGAVPAVDRGANLTDTSDDTAVTIRTFVGGNPSLVPELAKTRSFGVVLEPEFLPGFQLSADYYNIDVSGAITAPSPQQVIDSCAAGEASFCQFVYRNNVAGGTTGTITQVDAVFVNLAEFKTEGIDFEANYRFPLGGGTVTLNAVANHTIKFEQKTLATTLNFTGSQLNPRWAADGSIFYENGDTNFFLGATYRGPGRINPSFSREGLENNYTDSVTYISTAIGHTIKYKDKKFGLRFSINNLFNKKPPYGFPNVISGDTYDRVGRYFKLSLRYEM